MRASKIVPVLQESNALEIGTYVRIDNIDDDMHDKKGIFKGHFQHVNGIRSLIVLEDNNKNFYTFPENLKKA